MYADVTSQPSEAERIELEKELVRKTTRMAYLREMGMLDGIYGNKEACRRNNDIIDLRKRLGITSRQAAMLVNKYNEG